MGPMIPHQEKFGLLNTVTITIDNIHKYYSPDSVTAQNPQSQ